ncbi:MAG: hypothetical protein HC883_03955 [Bdellovibrionaceae bacterium]|nr:hypothetical protein [Pseudobdellovibrionaceae bacterium]
MPFTGNRLGGKIKVQYTSDAAQDYVLTTDPDLVIVGSGLVAGNVGQTTPGRFKPRGVHAQLVDTGKIFRKFFVCNAGSPLYSSNTPQAVVCDGATFTTTGRRGEKQTFS